MKIILLIWYKAERNTVRIPLDILYNFSDIIHIEVTNTKVLCMEGGTIRVTGTKPMGGQAPLIPS